MTESATGPRLPWIRKLPSKGRRSWLRPQFEVQGNMYYFTWLLPMPLMGWDSLLLSHSLLPSHWLLFLCPCIKPGIPRMRCKDLFHLTKPLGSISWFQELCRSSILLAGLWQQHLLLVFSGSRPRFWRYAGWSLRSWKTSSIWVNDIELNGQVVQYKIRPYVHYSSYQLLQHLAHVSRPSSRAVICTSKSSR